MALNLKTKVPVKNAVVGRREAATRIDTQEEDGEECEH